MSCVDCRLIVSPWCPHCQALWKSLGESGRRQLKSAGVIVTDVADYPYKTLLYDIGPGGGFELKVPQLICVADGVLYKKIILQDVSKEALALIIATLPQNLCGKPRKGRPPKKKKAESV